MSEERSNPKATDGARKMDDLLRDWPVSPPPSHGDDSDAWEVASAAIIEKAKAASAIEAADMDRLWAPPTLVAEADEPSVASASPSTTYASPSMTSGDKKMSDDRPSQAPRSMRKGGSLKELAERVSKTPPPASVKAVATPIPSVRSAELPPPSTQASPSTQGSATPLPTASATVSPLPSASPSSPPASVPPPVASVTPIASAKPANDTSPGSKTPETLPTGKAPSLAARRGGLWGIVGGGIVVLAAAAAAVLYVNHSKKAPPSNVAQTVETASDASATAAPEKPSQDQAPAKVAKNDSDPNSIDIDKLGDSKADSSADPATPHHGVAPKTSGTSVADTKDDGPHKVDADGTLDDAMKKAAGDDGTGGDKQPEAASDDARPKNLPDLPPTGSVTAAVGQVRNAARACVSGADGDSSAVITFGSSGAAQSVSVGGWAAGKPAEGCIKSALMGARVEPFTKPSFSAPMTIRP